MMANTAESNRSYRRGAIMGLTMAEAFILIAFALLLLFAFWQWETEKENTQEVEAFKALSENKQDTILASIQDGSMDAFVVLKDAGVNFTSPASVAAPQEKWRFIDKDDVLRLVDAMSELPDDMQRDLADMVESKDAKSILEKMGALDELVAKAEALDRVTQMQRLDDILSKSAAMDKIIATGRSVQELIEAAEKISVAEDAGETLGGISEKIRQAEVQQAELVKDLRESLGGLVTGVGGEIDDYGSLILPDTALFEQGEAKITAKLSKFLSDACEPWLTVLKHSGIDISEVKIEGHASSEWRQTSSANAAYLGNLNLSQERSQAVLTACLDYVKNEGVLNWAREHIIAVGYSSVRPVLKNGVEDRAASRRVVFSATPNRKALIDEIGDDAEAAEFDFATIYDRSSFGTWWDENDDCRNTRQEILIEQTLKNVSMSENDCIVRHGLWKDPYTGKDFTSADDVEIDHLVPVHWAWERGASQWDSEKKAAFYNDNANLFVVDATINSQKGANGPLDWMPPSRQFRCEYVIRFKRVMKKYQLDLKAGEAEAIDQKINDECI